MQPAAAYIARDRRRALATGASLPESTHGATLFADISGFTPLTTALVRSYGARRGADELTRHLNMVYTALINEVERYGGSVIGFSGDAITCWFAAASPASQSDLVAATGQAATAAFAMQAAMQNYQLIRLPTGATVTLAIKTAVAAGPARRFAVGDPAIQLIDVLAGVTLDRMAATEQMAKQGELLLDAPTVNLLQPALTIAEWRTQPTTGERFAVVITLTPPAVPVDPHPVTLLPEAAASAWVLPPVYARLQSEGGRFLAELRPATALFLKFTGLDYDHDADAANKLDQYIRWVQSIVNHYEGALIQLTTGDKGTYLYAAFGAPIAHDDDIRRAVTAALELRTPPPHCPFIATTQIGISQGAMRVGAYGSATRQTYGVLGDETVVAARLMTHAPPGHVLVSQVIADTISDEFRLQALGEVKLKGKATPQPLYAVLQPITRSRQLYDLYPTPLVGRTAELTRIATELEAVRQGQGRLVRLEGSAGVGKSHLVAETARQAQQQGLTIVSGACQSTNQDTAYFAIRLAMRGLFGIDRLDTMAVEAQIDQVTTAVTTLNPAWSLRLPLLRDLLALPIPDNATTAAFDAKLRYEALISLVVDLVQSYAQRQPLLLIFEDIHWMDEASQGVVLALARMVQSAPLLLLLVQRPPVREHDPFLSETAALTPQTHLSLEELTPEGIAALVQQRLNRTQGEPVALVSPLALSLIQVQTQGNPFFAEELVDALLDGGYLQRNAEGWMLSPGLIQRLRNSGCLARVDTVEVVAADAPLGTVEVGLPSTIQGVILARLDRLPEPVKLTVKVASVIGRLFNHELLLRAHPVQPEDALLTRQLDTLLHRDFARLEQPEPRRTYLFKHNITQEVVYQTLLADQRQELHLAVARTLEASQPEKVEDLALHYYNSDMLQEAVRDKAIHYLDAAGLRAKRDYANETALSYFNRALEIEERADWLKAKVEVLHILGRREEEAATLQSLTQQATSSPFDLALLWGEYYEAVSDYAQAEEAVKQALDLATRRNEQQGQALCLAQIGMIAWRQGYYEAAERSYNDALVMVESEVHYRNVEAQIHYGLGLTYRQQGKYEWARVQFEHDLTLNRILANRQNEARSLIALGHVELLRRNFNEAIQYYQEALKTYQGIGDRAGVGTGLLSLAQGLRNMGDYSQAEHMLNESLIIHQAINNRWSETLVWNELGIVYLLVGDLERAKICLENSLKLSQKIKDESGQAYSLCNLGQVLRDQGKLDMADRVLTEGLSLAQAQGDVQLEAICFSDLALVSLQANQLDEAIRRATTSLEKFKSLDLLLPTTTDVAILATAYMKQGNGLQAITYAQETLTILDECNGEGPDFPQRDYWMCYQVLHALDEKKLATHALTSAYRLLIQQAQRISDLGMRRSYLENVTFNHSILQIVDRSISIEGYRSKER
jgi:class 3 adenylate cyclase/tetratricopeptide (TPR) repeat protein